MDLLRPLYHVAILSSAATWSPAAGAAPLSVDIELVDPSFSAGSLLGMDSALIEGPGACRVGSFVQYEDEPLLLYVDDQERGTVIANRLSVQPGFSYDWSRRFSTSLLLPLVRQESGDFSSLSVDGTGLRDPRVGFRVALVRAGSISTAIRGDIRLPLGAIKAWMGEGSTRAGGALLLSAETGPIDILSELGFAYRERLMTGLDFVAGPELIGNLGARIWPMRDRIAIGASLLNRGGIERLGMGGAENSVEWTAGLQFRPMRNLQLDVGAGTGIVRGYGTTSSRSYVGLTWFRSPPATPKPEIELFKPIVEPAKAPGLDVVERVEASRPWEQGELARIEKREIVIREPIRFEFSTDRILPESEPVLEAIVRILADYWQINHVVIVGHASEEGSFLYNDELSVSRARAVFRAIVEAGIHPSRLSYRGMGEVLPASSSAAESSLVANRRVEFRIVHLLEAVEQAPVYDDEIRLPWTGTTVRIRPQGTKILGEAAPPTSVEPGPIDLIQQYIKEEEADDGKLERPVEGADGVHDKGGSP